MFPGWALRPREELLKALLQHTAYELRRDYNERWKEAR